MTDPEHSNGAAEFELRPATTTAPIMPVLRVRRTDEVTVQHPDLEPIFTELARQWTTAGRHVPGQTKGTITARRPAQRVVLPGH